MKTLAAFGICAVGSAVVALLLLRSLKQEPASRKLILVSVYLSGAMFLAALALLL